MGNEYYTMLGYDDQRNPAVEVNVTTDEAKELAAAKGLNWMLLSPHPSGSGKHITYMRVTNGEYEVVRMHVWLTADLTECTGVEVLGRDVD